MVSFMFAMIWGGGLAPAFRLARGNDVPFLLAIFDALVWPIMLGGALSTIVCGGVVTMRQEIETRGEDY